VLERNAGIGAETSSRNSEVIHAGIYYPPRSLRAQLCVRGRELLYRFCAENRVAHRRCGKLLVATHDSQLAALLSPSTGVIDAHALMLALQGELEARGGGVVLRCPVERIERPGGGSFRVHTGGADPARIRSANLVNCAGLAATHLARWLTYAAGYAPPETYFAKGQYYALSGRSPFQRHVYPMPDGGWLGLHATVDIAGRCKFGPDIAWVPDVDYGFEPEKLAQFLGFIRSYYPRLDAERLHADYTGIRPKLYRSGEPVADFAIHGERTHGQPGLVALYGIESPGLTAALAIGERVAALLAEP